MTYGIHTALAPKATGAHSQGAAAGRYVFISGQVGDDPATGEMADDLAGQTRQAIQNCRAILNEAKLDLEDVVKVTVYLTDLDDVEELDETYRLLFTPPRPARTCVEVARLRKGARVEIECTACR